MKPWAGGGAGGEDPSLALPSICRRGHLLFCVATSLGLLAGMSTTRAISKAQSASRAAILPLARQLAQRDRRKGATATRADIVSPALCDDILSYIGPSLEKYKNCDIVDVNPGAGLWSSKIHDFLKPRRHLLLEVDDFYTPCLQPLLDAPGSKYIRGPATDSVLSTLAGFELPLHRQDRMHQVALSLLKERDVEDVQAKLRADILPAQSPLEEMAELETRLKSKAPPVPNRAVWLQRLKHLQSNTERNLKTLRWKHVRLKELWATADEMRQLEMIVVDESRPAQERLAAKEHWEKLNAESKGAGRRGPTYIQQALFNVIDSRRGFYQDPPLLAWDDRPFEPLTTEPHEFYPQQSLCLLDSNPQPAPQEFSEEYIEYWQRFVNKLFERSSRPIGKALDHLRIGSAEVILPQVGAIHDPRRGGSLDVEDVRVRSMTPEMSYEIVHAWKNWTFRPQDLEETLTQDRLNWEELMDSNEEKRLSGDLFHSKITGPVSRP
ncbi:S-adenosyl-l-methionine-dependent methyltransferase [Lasiodiplodia theobromae]|uniref:S-adenosyl-l-methionine-dependent methyltransferase n=1 Tax=Lasiodiplodia theobromae TaxID=45133 RepID=UPI0015C3329E|nr:S-adenosyl-l-methionine-dependent methyltransferase [Lasiodiplodia theobromae]KAF4535259.1 S-adenosyl-l-methionine-dependent methyltransferase [Lasiodiplodia theobromae]